MDATFAIGDFCFGFARNQPEVWGLGMAPPSVPENHPPAALTSTRVMPVLTWNSARTGQQRCLTQRRTCAVKDLCSAVARLFAGVYEEKSFSLYYDIYSTQDDLI